MKSFKLIVMVIGVALLASCASTHVMVGAKRPAIDPSLVKIYSKPPSNYEDVAMISTSSKSSWAITDQGKMEKVIERLKEEAASLGANGVLLQGIGDQSGVVVGSSYGINTYGTGTTMLIPVSHKSGQGMAIYVIKE